MSLSRKEMAEARAMLASTQSSDSAKRSRLSNFEFARRAFELRIKQLGLEVETFEWLPGPSGRKGTEIGPKRGSRFNATVDHRYWPRIACSNPKPEVLVRAAAAFNHFRPVVFDLAPGDNDRRIYHSINLSELRVPDYFARQLKRLESFHAGDEPLAVAVGLKVQQLQSDRIKDMGIAVLNRIMSGEPDRSELSLLERELLGDSGFAARVGDARKIRIYVERLTKRFYEGVGVENGSSGRLFEVDDAAPEPITAADARLVWGAFVFMRSKGVQKRVVTRFSDQLAAALVKGHTDAGLGSAIKAAKQTIFASPALVPLPSMMRFALSPAEIERMKEQTGRSMAPRSVPSSAEREAQRKAFLTDLQRKKAAQERLITRTRVGGSGSHGLVFLKNGGTSESEFIVVSPKSIDSNGMDIRDSLPREAATSWTLKHLAVDRSLTEIVGLGSQSPRQADTLEQHLKEQEKNGTLIFLGRLKKSLDDVVEGDRVAGVIELAEGMSKRKAIATANDRTLGIAQGAGIAS